MKEVTHIPGRAIINILRALNYGSPEPAFSGKEQGPHLRSVLVRTFSTPAISLSGDPANLRGIPQ
ncbi:hypothetical protein FJW07_29600 [Mesorhizobium sp. B3-1-9]|uniref:hypothetical protein n=1 Tax=unclassified Mesorhizobium TaxID=325217 RepID=UPI00112AF08B|nr:MULTISPECIES: hypothetical protein [unclassified Mesorhizobium]TPI30246.1 hypothetical protein FJW07_29600 [Mesorhizobium sp. B3-1-9]TPI62593.1 hypothetical protein FJ424_20740 [Mesorhizobium sp. B3-1-8]TPI74163.1 hypothetical protein FJ420_07265 [Mesorhizobium sp. B3-1-3]